jgi:hypothetical protein
MVDMTSDRASSGSRGHRVVLTKTAAEAALPSLLGMALDYAPALDRRDVRRKVGVITRAEIIGRSVELGGYLFAKDFPEIGKEIGRVSRRYTRGIAGTLAAPQLGISYEVTDVQVADTNAKIWTLTHVTFTGAPFFGLTRQHIERHGLNWASKTRRGADDNLKSTEDGMNDEMNQQMMRFVFPSGGGVGTGSVRSSRDGSTGGERSRRCSGGKRHQYHA